MQKKRKRDSSCSIVSPDADSAARQRSVPSSFPVTAKISTSSKLDSALKKKRRIRTTREREKNVATQRKESVATFFSSSFSLFPPSRKAASRAWFLFKKRAPSARESRPHASKSRGRGHEREAEWRTRQGKNERTMVFFGGRWWAKLLLLLLQEKANQQLLAAFALSLANPCSSLRTCLRGESRAWSAALPSPKKRDGAL